MRRKTYLKAKKVQTFVDVLRMTAYEINLHAEAKA